MSFRVNEIKINVYSKRIAHEIINYIWGKPYKYDIDVCNKMRYEMYKYKKSIDHIT